MDGGGSWYVSWQGKIQGPLPWATLLELARLGRLKPEMLLSRDQHTWTPASRWADLFSPAPPSASPPRKPPSRPAVAAIPASAREPVRPPPRIRKSSSGAPVAVLVVLALIGVGIYGIGHRGKDTARRDQSRAGVDGASEAGNSSKIDAFVAKTHARAEMLGVVTRLPWTHEESSRNVEGYDATAWLEVFGPPQFKVPRFLGSQSDRASDPDRGWWCYACADGFLEFDGSRADKGLMLGTKARPAPTGLEGLSGYYLSYDSKGRLENPQVWEASRGEAPEDSEISVTERMKSESRGAYYAGKGAAALQICDQGSIQLRGVARSSTRAEILLNEIEENLSRYRDWLVEHGCTPSQAPNIASGASAASAPEGTLPPPTPAAAADPSVAGPDGKKAGLEKLIKLEASGDYDACCDAYAKLISDFPDLKGDKKLWDKAQNWKANVEASQHVRAARAFLKDEKYADALKEISQASSNDEKLAAEIDRLRAIAESGGKKGGAHPSPHANAIEVSLAALDEAYTDNEIGADQKYRGKWLRVLDEDGFAAVGRDGGRACGILSSGAVVLCLFGPEDEKSLAAAADKGGSIAVEGRCTGMEDNRYLPPLGGTYRTIVLEDCRIVGQGGGARGTEGTGSGGKSSDPGGGSTPSGQPVTAEQPDCLPGLTDLPVEALDLAKKSAPLMLELWKDRANPSSDLAKKKRIIIEIDNAIDGLAPDMRSKPPFLFLSGVSHYLIARGLNDEWQTKIDAESSAKRKEALVAQFKPLYKKELDIARDRLKQCRKACPDHYATCILEDLSRAWAWILDSSVGQAGRKDLKTDMLKDKKTDFDVELESYATELGKSK